MITFKEKVEGFGDQFSAFQLETWGSFGRVTGVEHRVRDVEHALEHLRGENVKGDEVKNGLNRLDKNFKGIESEVRDLQGVVNKSVEEMFERVEEIELRLKASAATQPKQHKTVSDVDIRLYIDQGLDDIRAGLVSKVDHTVLEELMRHVSTKDEIKKIIGRNICPEGAEDLVRQLEVKINSLSREISQSKIQQAGFSSSEISKEIEKLVRSSLDQYLQDKLIEHNHSTEFKFNNLKRDVLEMLDTSVITTTNTKGRTGDGAMKRLIENRVKKELRKVIERHMSEIEQIASLRFDEGVHGIEERFKALEANTQIPNSNFGGGEIEILSKKVVRDFDEKLLLICADLSECKSTIGRALKAPAVRYGQWVWKSGILKLGSAVPWNYQTVNTGLYLSKVFMIFPDRSNMLDPDNIRWDADSPTIRIQDAGLYEVTFGFFTRSKPSIQVCVNGESVMSAINASSYVVHHGSGFICNEGRLEAGTVTGLSLMVILFRDSVWLFLISLNFFRTFWHFQPNRRSRCIITELRSNPMVTAFWVSDGYHDFYFRIILIGADSCTYSCDTIIILW